MGDDEENDLATPDAPRCRTRLDDDDDRVFRMVALASEWFFTLLQQHFSCFRKPYCSRLESKTRAFNQRNHSL